MGVVGSIFSPEEVVVVLRPEMVVVGLIFSPEEVVVGLIFSPVAGRRCYWSEEVDGGGDDEAASAVASATMTPLNVEAPPSKLLELVAKGLTVEKDEMLRGVSSTKSFDSSLPMGYSSTTAPRVVAVDIGVVHDTKGASKSFPKHETLHISDHKNVARCARFSPDGKFLATGSADTSIKLFETSKVKQMMLPDKRDGQVRPGIRTFYDHLQPINDLDFHPQNTILISGAKDRTIKFFDFSKTVSRKAFRIIQDTHNVRSVSFHPSGEFLLAGTDHPIAHLYDVNTFQCYLSANVHEIGNNGAINQNLAKRN